MLSASLDWFAQLQASRATVTGCCHLGLVTVHLGLVTVQIFPDVRIFGRHSTVEELKVFQSLADGIALQQEKNDWRAVGSKGPVEEEPWFC